MLRVLHLTDTHVVAIEDLADPPLSFAGAVAAVQGRTTTESLRLVLDAVAADGFVPDLVLHTGDAVDDGEPASYGVLRSVLDAVGAPVLAVAGNHDRARHLAEAFGHEPASVRTADVDGWRLVLADTSQFDQAHGDLDDAGLEALDAALAGAPGPILVGLHHPPVNVCPDPACELIPAEAVLGVIDRHPGVRAVVSGHLHVTEDLERDGVAYLLSPSTCLQLRHEHPLPTSNRTPTPVGARVIELHDDGTVSSRIVWTAEQDGAP